MGQGAGGTGFAWTFLVLGLLAAFIAGPTGGWTPMQVMLKREHVFAKGHTVEQQNKELGLIVNVRMPLCRCDGPCRRHGSRVVRCAARCCTVLYGVVRAVQIGLPFLNFGTLFAGFVLVS
jgi:hypothetical protein